jgi:predicted O-methyltransferase YrrM
VSPVVRAHWTPRYVVDRSRLALRQRRHPHDPWLTADAVRFLASWIRTSDRCLEWGSGRSTVWMATRAATLVSIEHDREWSDRVTSQVADLPSATVRLVDAADADRYANPPDVDAVDLALVDGIHRGACALTAIERVVPGGIIVVDNVERYLPSRSRAPEAIGNGYEDDSWHRFDDRTSGWRRYWTSDGVTDTAVFFKPPSAAAATED